MMRITKYDRHVKITYLKMAALIIMVSFFLLPNYVKVQRLGDNVFDITLNGQYVGCVSSREKADRLLWRARKQLANETEGMLLTTADLTSSGREAYFVKFTANKEMIANMKEALLAQRQSAKSPAYTIKINQLMVSLRTIGEVEKVLQAAIDHYQDTEIFSVSLGPDADREINVLTAQVKTTEQIRQEEDAPLVTQAGVTYALSDMLKDVQAAGEKSFDDFEYGLKDISYEDKVEIVETYLPQDQIQTVAEAIDLVTQLQEKEIVYEVAAGDTLSEIALQSNIPLDKIIALNENLEDEASTIRIGDELKLTEPEPELSVAWQQELYYEEDYEAEIEYVYNDDWYTTDTLVLQQPSAGHRKVAALKTYHNEKEVDTQILKEEITVEAVPKIVEKGTKIPPTYIKPISGGRVSSGFGRRKAPRRGASTYHKGIDWATPVGTAVVASSGGTVTKAGWGSGYGYVVYINHADGRQTRYGHLSKVLVKAGDYVSQGQKIALSGNTGRSTGPHLHFEILINGSAVNPLQYLN